jgi:hypothetical protein
MRVEHASNSLSQRDGSTDIVAAQLTPNPTVFQTGSAREPYNRGQWGSALRTTPKATMGDVTDGRGLQTTCPFTCPRFPASLASLTDKRRELLSDLRLKFGRC